MPGNSPAPDGSERVFEEPVSVAQAATVSVAAWAPRRWPVGDGVGRCPRLIGRRGAGKSLPIATQTVWRVIRYLRRICWLMP